MEYQLIDTTRISQNCERSNRWKGVDHILDPIGGDNLAKEWGCLAEGGKVVHLRPFFGRSNIEAFSIESLFALEKDSKFDALRLMTRNKCWCSHGDLENEEAMAQQLYRIMEGVKEGHLKPVIDSVFDAKDVAKAHQHIHDAKISVKFFFVSLNNFQKKLPSIHQE